MLDKLLNSRRNLLVANYSFWFIVILISASQLYLRYSGSYDGGWFNFFWRQTISWIGWAVLTPLIIRAINYIQSKSFDRKILTYIHLGTALAFTLIYVFMLSVLSVIFFSSETPLIEFIRLNIISATVTNLLVYALIAAFGFTLIFYRKTKEDEQVKYQLNLKNQELEKQLVDFQLSTLKMQLQPHFLFNAFHSVSSLVRKGKNEKAIDTIALISDLLRTTLNQGNKEFVSVEEEIEIIQKYLSIEEIRFGDKLEVEYYIEDELMKNKIPYLILQPIVENIFKHAFKNRLTGNIQVSCKKINLGLEIKIKDNGQGLKDGFMQKHHLGLGLSNVKTRLNTIYGEKSSFDISNRQSEGTVVTLIIPINSSVL